MLEKYKQNLRVIGNEVYSYNTKVAIIEAGELRQLGWWSVTTQKHINYVARELGLKIISLQKDIEDKNICKICKNLGKVKTLEAIKELSREITEIKKGV